MPFFTIYPLLQYSKLPGGKRNPAYEVKLIAVQCSCSADYDGKENIYSPPLLPQVRRV